MDDFDARVRAALARPENQGEMQDADAVGTAGSPGCGDMVRLWLKFTEKDGRRVIDRASFQAFGCQTAMAVAAMATNLLQGRTAEEARHLDATDLGGELGPLPPMKIHCGQLVQEALQQALAGAATPPAPTAAPNLPTLLAEAAAARPGGKIRVVPLDESPAP